MTPAALQYLVKNGYPDNTPCRMLKDGRITWVHQLMFTYAVLVCYVGEMGYHDRWCFHRKEDAVEAMLRWEDEPEPEGWHRNPKTGRRRPDGDKTKEYVEF